MAEGKAIDKANLELALSENNKRALEYIDAADNKIRRQLNRSNFIFVDDYDPCNGIIAEGLTYYIDFLDSYRSPDVSYVHNVINNEQYAQNNGVFINNKKGVFGGSQYLHAQDIKVQYPVTLEFLLQFDSSKNQIVFFENYSPRIVCGYWNTYFMGGYKVSGVYKGGKTFPYDFSELTNKVNLLTICYENEDAMTIYVNGVKLEEQDETNYLTTSTFTGTYIGRRSYKDSDKFQGNMYRIRIYDRILTQEEILLNYTADTEFINSSVEYGKQYNLNILGYENEVIGIEDTPVGHIISHMGMEVPKHYLACDGSEYNIADYTYLAEHILNEFGSYNYFGGDGINTFAVPDLRGEFLRGTGTNSHTNQGSGVNVGEHQDGSIIPRVRYNNGKIQMDAASSANLLDIVNADKEFKVNGRKWVQANTDNGSDTHEVISSYTTRPTNTSVLYCIKYEPTYYINVTQTISLEEANELKEQNQLLKKQNQLLQQEIEALNVIIDSNKTTI